MGAALLVVGGLLAGPSIPGADAAPAHDQWGQAMPVGSLPFHHRLSAEAGSSSVDDPTSCGNAPSYETFWYRFSPATTEAVLFDTMGSARNTNYYGIFTRDGSGWRAVRCVPPTADSNGVRFTETLSAGTTYYVMVARGSRLVVDLRLARPSEQGASLASAIPVGLGRHADDPLTAWTPPDDSGCLTLGPRVIFHRYTAGFDQGLAVSFGPDVHVNVYTSAPGGPPVSRGCQAYGTTFRLPLRAGQTLWFALRYKSDAFGVHEYELSPSPLVANDDFADALDLAVNTSMLVDLRTASVEDAELTDNCSPSSDSRFTSPRRTAWFRVEIPAGRAVELLVSGGRAQLQRATSASQGTCINLPSGGGPVEAGAYHLRVLADPPSPWANEATGIVELYVDAFPLPPHHRAENALALVPGEQVVPPARLRGHSSLWYRFSSPDDAVYELAPATSPNQPYSSSVYFGSPDDLVREGSTPRHAAQPPQRVAQIRARPGVTYFVETWETRPFTLRRLEPRPVNDFEWRPLPVPSLPFHHAAGEGRRTVHEVYSFGAYDHLTRPEGPSCQHYAGGLRWFDFRPLSDGRALLDTSGSLFETVVGVYELSGGSRVELGCAAPTATRPQGRVAFEYQAGRTYHLVVGGNTTSSRYDTYDQVDSGRLELSLTEVPPVPNDDFLDAVRITSLPHELDIDLLEPTVELGESTPSCGPAAGTVWYRVDVPGTTGIVIEAEPEAGPSPLIAVHQGGRNREIACGEGRVAYRHAQPEGPFYIQVAGDGRQHLRFRSVPVPANDGWGAAVEITSPRLDRLAIGGWSDERSTDGAGVQANEAVDQGQSATVWYRYSSPVASTVVLDVIDSSFDARFAVYEQVGGVPARPVGVVGGDRRGRFVAEPGRTYLVQVWGDSGATGDLRISAGLS